MSDSFDFGELIKRAIKYLIEGFIVGVAAYTIPKKSLALEEVLIIGLMAAATFSILDVFIPSMGQSARSGAGAGLGINLIGGLKMAGGM